MTKPRLDQPCKPGNSIQARATKRSYPASFFRVKSQTLSVEVYERCQPKMNHFTSVTSKDDLCVAQVSSAADSSAAQVTLGGSDMSF